MYYYDTKYIIIALYIFINIYILLLLQCYPSQIYLHYYTYVIHLLIDYIVTWNNI